MDGPALALITREGSRFYISTRIIDFSNFIKEKIENLEYEEVAVDVPYSTLQKVKEFYEHHEYKDIKSVRKPIKTSNFATLASEWDNMYFKSLSEEEISDLVLAANHLQCEALFEYSCAFLASQFKDLTLEEVKKKYDITDELTPELEENLKKDYAFIFRDLATENQNIQERITANKQPDY